MNEPLYFAQILAEGTAEQSNGEAEAAPAGFDPLLLILLGLLVVFMIFTFRRGKKMRDSHAQAMSGAVIGAEVITNSGMIGTIVNRDEERQRVTLEFSEGHRVDFTLAAVQQILSPAPSSQDPTDPTEGPEGIEDTERGEK